MNRVAELYLEKQVIAKKLASETNLFRKKHLWDAYYHVGTLIARLEQSR